MKKQSKGILRQNDFRQMCVLWLRQNRPDVVQSFYAELDKKYPLRRARIKLPEGTPK